VEASGHARTALLLILGGATVTISLNTHTRERAGMWHGHATSIFEQGVRELINLTMF
jgi:hypothetical protein